MESQLDARHRPRAPRAVVGLYLAAIAFVQGVAHADEPMPAQKWLHAAHAGALDFHGAVDMSAASGPNFRGLYPGFDPLTFLASVAVHAVVENSMHDRQRAALVTSADGVLAPYRDVLAGFDADALLRRTTTHHAIQDEPPPGTTIDVDPHFVLSQDQRGLLLDCVVVVQRPGIDAASAYRNVVRVIAPPVDAADATAYWLDADGAALKDTSAELLALAIAAALADARQDAGASAGAPPAAEQRTVRYRLGGEERMERAKPLVTDCSRMLMRTLRGWLMSVPRPTEDPAPEGCS